MTERINVPFTNEHFADFCLKMVGQPYWYGTCGYKATTGLLNRKANQYPSHYGSSRTSRYKKDIQNKAVVADCIGGAKGYAWTGGGQAMLDVIGTDSSVANKYGANNCPDKGANSMFSYAKGKGMAWGSIGTLPEIVGLALHTDGHVGYYVGGGYAVEWRGFNYGCVKTKVSERSWKHWYQLPFINYGENMELSQPSVANISLGSRLLKRGMEGADVKALQELLLRLGYALSKHGADGDFGVETEKAVRAFQKAEGLDVDGKYGDKSHAALMDVIADEDDPEQAEPGTPSEDAPEPMPETPSSAGRKVVIVSDGGKVNIRCGNGAGYARLSQVAPGSTYDYVATASNGWHALALGSKVGWVSGGFSRVI